MAVIKQTANPLTKPLPNPDVAVLNDDGTMSRHWYDYFFSHDAMGLAGQAGVSTVSPTNGQVLIWNDITKLWTPGAN